MRSLVQPHYTKLWAESITPVHVIPTTTRQMTQQTQQGDKTC